MTEKEIEIKIQQKIESLFNEIGFIKSNKIIFGQRIGNFSIDIIVEAQVKNTDIKFIIEIKSPGEPKQIRGAIQQLREYAEILENDGLNIITRTTEQKIYRIVAAPYITEDSAQICKKNGVGYIDLAGNCSLRFEEVFIEFKNYPNPYKEKRIVRSIFTPKASRILRVMLSNPKKSWQVQELAKAANVSLGQAYKVKERLLSLEYAGEDKKSIVLKQPDNLLLKWADYYDFRKNKLYDYFAFGEPGEVEQKIGEYCEKNGIVYGLTLFSGAERVAPHSRYTRSFVYIKERRQELVNSLKLKEVESGPNVTILEPYDDGILYGLKEINGIKVVCDIQLYIDLFSYKGRGDEAANFLLEQRIKPQW